MIYCKQYYARHAHAVTDAFGADKGMTYYLAIDIGASSGRHIVGWIDGGKMQTDEVYRFGNGVCNDNGRLTWDVKTLFDNTVEGIKVAFGKYPRIASVAIDTWGVDYVLMNGDREILPCRSYRDVRTRTAVERVHGLVPFAELYARTGIQFQPFNTAYQLFDDAQNGRLNDATDFLMIPEYLSYKLTGVKSHEYTNATTTGLVNCASGQYDREIIRRLGLPDRLFCELAKPGAVVGSLAPSVSEYVGGQTQVVLCASHDTASAVEGIPMTGDQPYISSGTWSLLGVKLPAALTDENSSKANYSNEGGVGYIRYQKNIAGMWVVNRLRDELCPDKPWNEITAEASASKFDAHADINSDAFLSPESMKAAFDAMLDRKPKAAADYFDSAYISLAHGYKRAIAELEANTGRKYDELYIVGGGAKNAYLNGLVKDICGVKVNALPIEATALGNLKIQAKRNAAAK